MAPKHTSSSSSNNCYGEVFARRANILASCYVVDADTTLLKGFHYSTTCVDGKLLSISLENASWQFFGVSRKKDYPDVHSSATILQEYHKKSKTNQVLPQGQSGIPEVSSELPSPPSSPPLAALTTANELALAPKNKRRDGNGGQVRQGGRTATYTIREKCERLFCETLKNVFLGERDRFGKCSADMVTDLHLDADMHSENEIQMSKGTGSVDAWFEVWDYVGGASFRGFVAGPESDRCMFTFFDAAVVGKDLKQGLMALIELSSSAFECEQLVICIDRNMDEVDMKSLMKSLRWVGFELVTLDMWSKGATVPTSDRWLFLGMEL